MTTLQIGLTISVVGPREKLLETEEWPMALRLTAGSEPGAKLSLADARALIEETVPWELWKDLSNGVEIAITSRDHTVSATRSRPVIMPATAENGAFLQALKATILKRALTLANDNALEFAYRPSHTEVADEDAAARAEAGLMDAPGQDDSTSWPGLLATLPMHAAPTPAALRAVWYFTMPRAWVATLDEGVWVPNDVFVSAAPAKAQDAAHGGYSVQPEGGTDKYPVHVHQYTGIGTKAYCQALRIQSVIAHDVDEMDNFWLAIRDSGDESLLDLGLLLDAACEPAALLASLSADELAAAMEVTMGAGPLTVAGTRAPTAPEAARAVEDWKDRLAVHGTSQKTRARVLKAAANARTDQTGALRDEFRLVGTELLATLDAFELPGGAGTVSLPARHHAQLAATATARLLPSGTRGAEVSTPAEGVSLVLGDMSLRLRHVTDPEFGAVDDVAQIQLFGRRSSAIGPLDGDPAAQDTPKWHCLSGGLYRMRETGEEAVERLLGVTATYVDDVLCREIPYSGSNVACVNPMQGAHRESMQDGPQAQPSLILAPLDRIASTQGQLRVLPMRYGDYYEFAAAVIDRAGGMAAELTNTYPWDLDLSRLSTLRPPQHDRTRYLRRSAVGDCEVQPLAGTVWPQPPSNLVLRGTEALPSSTSDGPAAMTVLLAPPPPARDSEETDRFNAPADGVRPAASYAFCVTAPRASEHVQMRWKMPDTTLAPSVRGAAAAALAKQVGDIVDTRDAFLSKYDPEDEQTYRWAIAEAEKFLPVDPAVADMGMRWSFGSGASGHARLGLRAGVQVAWGDSSKPGAGNSFTLAEGDYVQLRFYTLVATSDMDRFDPALVAGHLAPPGEQLWPGLTAFAPKIVVAECATSVLPELDAARLSVEEDASGNVRVFYDFAGKGAANQAAFLHVEQLVIASERWVWRNLPLPPEAGYAGTGDDRARRLASGPPAELMDAAVRDSAATVTEFDQLIEIDDGFAGRADEDVDYPRQAAARLLLWVDGRNAHTQAEYLRYALACRSRYASVLREPLSRWSGKRRIAVGFRGDTARIKPPRVLAVLPLTQAMPLPVDAPVVAAAKETAPPFLVVLDERWFREYGVGERMVARVARVKPEIPETPANPPSERRYGPLPDHRLDLSAADPTKPLEVFGPFGLSQDRTGSQALANASAFVVYPPAGTPPHFNIFAEFARVLDQPTPAGAGQPSSEYTEAVALYTLPDMAGIALGTAGAPLQLRADGQDFVCTGGERLQPFAGAGRAAMDQYRYLLLVGHHVRDGGRALDVFLPSDAMWLAPSAGGTVRARWVGAALRDPRKSGFNAAVVLEVMLNGRFPVPADPRQDVHPLSGASNMGDVFRAMLSDAQGAPAAPDVEDAPGMIRRASAWFPLEFPK